jgi:hypothetical protein
MYPYMNEDAAWQRLQDIQREMENSRIWVDGSASLVRLAIQLARRVWILAGLAMRRPPRRGPSVATAGERKAA